MSEHASHSRSSDTARNESVPSSTFDTLATIAEKKYSPYRDMARRFDDAGEVFSSTMSNFLKGNSLTTKVALIAAAMAAEKVAQ